MKRETGRNPAVRETGRNPAVRQTGRSQAVREVMEQAASYRATKSVPLPPVTGARQLRKVAVWICTPLLAFSAYALIVQPEFLMGVKTKPRSAPVVDANSRMVLYLLAQRLEQYHADEGVYPQSLRAIGQETEGVTYTALGDTAYVLQAVDLGRDLVLRSGDDLGQFVGSSLHVLRGGSQ